MPGVTDLEIYQRFTAICEELESMLVREPSLVGGVALQTACRSLRGMASAIYEHGVGEPDEPLKRH